MQHSRILILSSIPFILGQSCRDTANKKNCGFSNDKKMASIQNSTKAMSIKEKKNVHRKVSFFTFEAKIMLGESN